MFEARCGKGTYVRAIARDLGRLLGCFGHVFALRRTRVGPFTEADAVALSDLEKAAPTRMPCGGRGRTDGIAANRGRSRFRGRLRRGQSILLRGADAPMEGAAFASCGGVVVAVGAVERGELVPGRVFNLPF